MGGPGAQLRSHLSPSLLPGAPCLERPCSNAPPSPPLCPVGPPSARPGAPRLPGPPPSGSGPGRRAGPRRPRSPPTATCRGPGRGLHLSPARPPRPLPLQLLVLLHGGGWGVRAAQGVRTDARLRPMARARQEGRTEGRPRRRKERRAEGGGRAALSPPTQGRGVETTPRGHAPCARGAEPGPGRSPGARGQVGPLSYLAGSGGGGLSPHPEAQAGLWAPSLRPGTAPRAAATGAAPTCRPAPPSFRGRDPDLGLTRR